MKTRFAVLALVLVSLAGPLLAQTITLPPNGDNQRSSVTQYIGLVRVTIDYNSPDVHAPNGEDRTGKIWGELVPWGMPNLGFGTCTECPWRAGANENTVFTVSHDVKIEGQPLPAGSYGLHMIPGQDQWTIIFSRDDQAWGSFFYDPAKDALRVKVTPAKSDYDEWLTFNFIDRQPAKAVVALEWENLEVPWTITVDDMTALYMDRIRAELRGQKGFTWVSWNAAAQYALQTKSNLAEGLSWAEQAVGAPFIGQENFATLSTLAQLQEANGQSDKANATMQRALNHGTASPIQIHQHGRTLLTQGKKDDALKVFQLNAKKFPDAWPVNVGLARGYAAVGNNKSALKYAKLALKQAPDEVNRKSLESMIQQLEEGKDVN